MTTGPVTRWVTLTGATARLASLALLALGGLAGLVASAQPWWRLTAAGSGAPVDTPITGSTASAGLSQVLPACVLIAGLLVLVLRSTLGRRIVAGLALVLGAGTAVLGGWHPRPDASTVTETLRQSSLADSATLTATGWPGVYLAAGLLAILGAVLIMVRVAGWPRRADRYAVGTAVEVRAAQIAADPDTWWKAMDAGVDPTVPEPAPEPGPEVAESATADETGRTDPISDHPGSSATMAAHDQQHHGQSGSGSDR